jgi:hypothetical protein
MYVLVVSILPLSTISLFDFGIVRGCHRKKADNRMDKKKEEKDNNGRQETTQKITDWAARSQPKNSGAPPVHLTSEQSHVYKKLV